MPTPPTYPTSGFRVKEDKLLNFLIGGMCFVFFIISIVNWTNSYIDYLGMLFFLGPALLFIAKGIKNRTVIAINTQGIFYHGKLVTNWNNFQNVQLTEDQKLASISDNFVLVIKCLNTETGKVYERKIKLSNTQSKSEESIVAAIKYYHKLAKENYSY